MENKPHVSEDRKKELFRKMGIDEVGGTAAVDLKVFEIGHLHTEYICDEGDLLMHFFWRKPPPKGAPPVRDPGNGMPLQDNYAPWPHGFRERLWSSTLETFKLMDEKHRVELEWISEFQSWCVFVRGVAKIITPPQPMLVKLATESIGPELDN